MLNPWNYRIDSDCSELTLDEGFYKKRKDEILEYIEKYNDIDFIMLKHTGLLCFVHYSSFEFENLEKSIESEDNDLTFGDGIYCYDINNQEQESWGDYKYIGLYYGNYYECIYDRAGTKDKEHELVIKNAKSIPVIRVSDEVIEKHIKLKLQYTPIDILRYTPITKLVNWEG